MSKYRDTLPQMERFFLTEGGMETVMIFREGIELASFAAIDLMRRPDGADIITRYFKPYFDIAKSAGAGFILDTPTWRASPDWTEAIGFADRAALAEANKRGTALIAELREANETAHSPMLVAATIGPRGDGYAPDTAMSAAQSEAYHSWQVDIFADTPADFISALTMTTANEAIGIARAAKARGLPVAISFTVETDASLPDGTSLECAINKTDNETGGAPAYYMINCAHPTHFASILGKASGDWTKRIRGVRANASKRSHAELDCACDLDDGNPSELGCELADLRRKLPQLTILGGCCGTDDRHIAEIAKAVKGMPKAA